MTNLQIFLSLTYAAIQVLSFTMMTSDMGADAYRDMLIKPFRDGITVGDVFLALLFLPALLLNMLIFNSLPFILDAMFYLGSIRLTKPRNKQ